MQTNKPFSVSYVIGTTVQHMRKAVDISIRKTFERVAEFDGNTEKSTEVFRALSILHDIRKQLDSVQVMSGK